MCQTCDIIRGLLLAQGVPQTVIAPIEAAVEKVEKKVVKKGKQKLNRYQKWMKKEMKILRRKHPRMTQSRLMQEAARIWRSKKRKGKK